ncbi:hypothetical protein QQS21_004755 [Conoideocrella luteorostrata]|uniref:Uncharacterized protein n=1 Tax=Conoideocrella luteorostrata TaxID=1105319 RepID=A0AAJ0FZM3_9HYPO|nr:hypothetical protein QQS21_004755 [Conoideocrella luteorostrata]
MPDAGVWNSFTAFEGTLSAAFLATPPVQPNNPDLDNTTKCVLAAVQSFRTWLAKVREDPVAHGFATEPINYSKAAKDVIDAFFPLGQRPLRIRTGKPPPGVPGQAVIKPVMVPFAAADKEMGIADGASALGYLFSVVSPPAQVVPTWETYFFPLTVLYAWCVYLTYINYDPTGPLDIAAVPAMTCVMYLERPDASPLFFLGHTKARCSINDKEFVKDGQDNALCLHYRAGQIQRAAQIGDRPSLPVRAPYLRESIERALYERLEGQNVYNVNAQSFLQPIFSGFNILGKTGLFQLQQHFITLMIAEYIQAQTPIFWMPVTNLHWYHRRDNPLTSAQMAPAVSSLVNDFLAGAQPLQLAARWITVLKLYIAPALQVPADNPSPYPVFVPGNMAPVPPAVQTLIDTAANSLYNAREAALQQKLSKIVQLCRGIPTATLSQPQDIALEQNEMKKMRRDIGEDYGRCAETLCAFAVSELFYPTSIITAADGPRIRGWALETRRIGQGAAERNAFGTNFDKIKLDSISLLTGGSVYRLPCADYCQTMLKHVQMRSTEQEEEAYNAALRVVDPMTVALPDP